MESDSGADDWVEEQERSRRWREEGIDEEEGWSRGSKRGKEREEVEERREAEESK